MKLFSSWRTGMHQDVDLTRRGLSNHLETNMRSRLQSCLPMKATASTEQEATASTYTPKVYRGTKRKANNTSLTMMNIAFDILKNVEDKMDKKPSQPDEISAFFNYVTAKVQKYSPETQKAVQHVMFDVLLKADRGLFDSHPPNYSSGWQTSAVRTKSSSSIFSP